MGIISLASGSSCWRGLDYYKDKRVVELNKMSKQELIEELIQVFNYGPEWIYNDFVKRNLY